MAPAADIFQPGSSDKWKQDASTALCRVSTYLPKPINLERNGSTFWNKDGPFPAQV